MKSPKISIITAVYNMENYIHRCIDSIINQTFKDFELIIINDGSTDKSGEICNQYAQNDKRIKVYHKSNGGVASARELGTNEAKGIFSIHIDPDDWIEENMLEEMYNQIILSKTDILITDYYVDTAQTNIYKKQEPRSLAPNDLLSDLIQGKFFGGLCHKLIRHSLYSQYNIHYLKGINYCEDFLIWAQLLQYPITISYLDKAFYHYCIDNTNSISRKYTIDTYNIRKKFFFTLKGIVPQNLKESLINVAINIKIEAFINGVMTHKEFNTFAPIGLIYILFKSQCSIKMKIILAIAKLLSFKVAFQIYKKLN